MKKQIIIFLSLVLFTSCVSDPDNPVINNPGEIKTGAFILCEGLYKSDNASITRYDLESGGVTENFYQASNPGLKLGDLANHIAIFGDTAWVSVSSSNTIESFRVSSGKAIGRIVLEEDLQPRKLLIVNKALGFFTNFNRQKLMAFNPSKMELLHFEETGPAAEGLVSWDEFLFIANSGAGDLMKDEPDAGTIYVINYFNGRLEYKFEGLPNVYELLVDSENARLYARYLHYYSEPDSLSGIVCYDLLTFSEIGHWRDRTTSFGKVLTLADKGSTLYYLNNKGVAKINTTQPGSEPEQFIINDKEGKEFWYSLSVSPDGKSLWVGNAKNYQVKGEVLIYDIENPGSPREKFSTGINPNQVIFY